MKARPVDPYARHLFGMTAAEAIIAGRCIRCPRAITYAEQYHWTPSDRAEYRLSALCPKCYAELMEAAG